MFTAFRAQRREGDTPNKNQCDYTLRYESEIKETETIKEQGDFMDHYNIIKNIQQFSGTLFMDICVWLNHIM